MLPVLSLDCTVSSFTSVSVTLAKITVPSHSLNWNLRTKFSFDPGQTLHEWTRKPVDCSFSHVAEALMVCPPPPPPRPHSVTFSYLYYQALQFLWPWPYMKVTSMSDRSNFQLFYLCSIFYFFILNYIRNVQKLLIESFTVSMLRWIIYFWIWQNIPLFLGG